MDGSLSPGQTLVGPNYAIGANLGRQVGGNLFQSFGLFSLSQGESATFSGPATVTNVIGRVTGGAVSSINGAIKSTIAGTNVYLINPAGIVFGPNATVNVSGSFHASTADYLRLSDGARFQATNPGGSTLSAAPPAAFGFLNPAPAQITVNGSQIAVGQNANGKTIPGQTLSLIGGPVTIQAASAANGGSLTAPSGTIHVVSAAGPGEVPVDPANSAALTVASFGPVSILGGTPGNVAVGEPTLDITDAVGKTSGGGIIIRAGSLTIARGFFDATNFGGGTGGQIALQADSQINLSNGTIIQTGNAPGVSGSAGQLTVTAGALSISGGTTIGSLVEGSGSAGPISITANSIVIDGSASTTAVTGIRSATAVGSAKAADITVNAGTLTILANGEIVTNTFGAGNAGSVAVAVAGAASINATGARFSTGIGSVASPGSSGNAGTETISAASLSIVGNPGPLLPSPFAPAAQPFAGLSAQTLGAGMGGSITLDLGAGGLAMSNAAAISTSTGGAGQGGSVNVAALGPLVIGGAGTAITASALSGATGSGGSVAVSAPQITVEAGAQIASTTAGTGSGGAVSVTTPGTLLLDGMGVADTQIAASATGPLSGPGGAVTVTAGSLTIQGGAQIASSTAGPGNGGQVAVTVAGDIALTGPGPEITALSTGSGDAGSILLSAFNLALTDGAAISSAAATANGGNIALAIGDFLHLVDSQITTSVKGASGNGGNIAIDSQLLVLDNSQIIAQAVLGHGGNITIVADNFFPSADSLVSASSALGISGTVEIVGPRVDLNGTLVVLPSELRSAAEVFRDSCAARGNRPRSSLTEAGRGGLPQDPEATLFALYVADRDFAPAPSAAAGQNGVRGDLALTTVRLRMHCS